MCCDYLGFSRLWDNAILQENPRVLAYFVTTRILFHYIYIYIVGVGVVDQVHY